MKDAYKTYEQALDDTGLDTLSDRREQLSLNFAKKCTKNPRTKEMFPLNTASHDIWIRKTEKYFVQPAKTERLAKSTIPYLQRQLNLHCNN